MKQCPSCKTNYADDTLQFCLQDGTQLMRLDDRPTFDSSIEQPTVYRPKTPAQVVPLDTTPAFQTQPQWQSEQAAPAANYPAAPRKSSTLVAVLLTALVMLLLFAAGAWFYLRSEQRPVAVNVNANLPVNRASNANQAGNQNTPTPTATPTPRPTLDPKQARAVTDDVKNVIDDWNAATENLDMETHLDQYAETVDYYKAGRVGVGRVRADKEKAFEAYDTIDIDISNVKITPDDSGERATALFDKEWRFEGADKYSAGKVQQQLTLAKTGDRWRITGEKDLKVYYVEK